MSDGKRFHSILFADRTDYDGLAASEPPECFGDLSLDRIIAGIVDGRPEYDLTPFFHTPLSDPELIAYRQAVMRDVEDPDVHAALRRFSGTMRSRQRQLHRAATMAYPLQGQRWLLDAADSYRRAVVELRNDLAAVTLRSEGLRAFADYLAAYADSDTFCRECEAIDAVYGELEGVHYAILAREEGFEVRRYDGEPDYGDELERAFEPLRENPIEPTVAAKRRETPAMNHIEAKILEFVARLYPDVFAHLARFGDEYGRYADATLVRFEREVQFYLAVQEYVARLQKSGLAFCYPALQSDKAGIRATETFDLALADTLAGSDRRVVCNDFHLEGEERVLVVSGPNQGGKTTFARTVGQLHYLARLGCPVPGRRATLLLADGVYTHFDREENIADLRGKLEDDLVRVEAILEAAGPSSVVILNEIFHSTTVKDATFLTTRILEQVMTRGALCVCVTFIDEVSRLGEATVSMVSTMADDTTEERSYRLVRMPADGRAYALSIAQRHGLTYDRLRQRLAP